MIHISAPGKLMIAGEWAVLEGYPCVVAAVNRRVHCEIEEKDPDEASEITLKDFNVHAKILFANDRLTVISGDDKKLKFAKAAIETVLRYIGKMKSFRLTTWNEKTEITKNKKTKKLGFGSSSAAVVSIISAVLAFHGQDISSISGKVRVYKLATIAHYKAQGKIGSAFDIAAATFGGVLVYRRVDAAWLEEELRSNTLKEVVNKQWPQMSAEEINFPMALSVAWTGKQASTSQLVREMNEFRERDTKIYREIYSRIGYVVEDLVDAIKDNDKENIISLLNENHKILSELSRKSKVKIQTTELQKLHRLAHKYGAGKLSGAGGGDCGIGISDRKDSEKIRKAWKASGLHVIDIDIEKEGVKQHA